MTNTEHINELERLRAIVERVEKLLSVAKNWKPKDDKDKFYIRRLEELLKADGAEEDGGKA